MTNVAQNPQGQNNLPAKKANIVTIDHLKTLNPVHIADDELVGGRFIDIYNNVNGTELGSIVYNAEKFYYMKQLQENPALKDCTPMSLYGSFLDVAVNGLSFDPKKKLCYLIPRSVNVAPKGSPAQWEKRCSLEISPDGEIAVRMNKGQIKHVDNPILVYTGDTFEILSGKDGTVVNYSAKFPRAANARIIGGFIRIVRTDGSIDFSYMLQADIDRLKGYSERQNAKYVDDGQGGKKKVPGAANELYSSGADGTIDTGFLMAKIKKHAFDSYPKVIKGNFAVEAPLLPAGHKPEEHVDYYGVENVKQVPASFDEEANGSQAVNAVVQPGVQVDMNKEDSEAGF